MTSAITRTEVFYGQMTLEQKRRYADVFRKYHVQEINVDSRIADRASSIREHYHAKGIKVRTPDALHLASAIIYEADVMFTLDGAGSRQRPHSLLKLNGNVANYPLVIVKPWASAKANRATVPQMTRDQGTLLPGPEDE